MMLHICLDQSAVAAAAAPGNGPPVDVAAAGAPDGSSAVIPPLPLLVLAPSALPVLLLAVLPLLLLALSTLALPLLVVALRRCHCS